MINIKNYIIDLKNKIEALEFEDKDKLKFLKSYKIKKLELLNYSFEDLFILFNAKKINLSDYNKYKKYLSKINSYKRIIIMLEVEIRELLNTNINSVKNLIITDSSNYKKDFKKINLSKPLKLALKFFFTEKNNIFDIDGYNFFIKILSDNEGLDTLVAIHYLLNMLASLSEIELFIMQKKIFSQSLKYSNDPNKNNLIEIQSITEEVINKTINYISSLETKEKKFSINKNKKIKALNEVLECLNSNKKIDIKNLEKYIDDINLIIMANIYNDSLTKNNYLKAKEDNIKLTNIEVSDIKQILYSFNINLDENKLTIDLDTLKTKLENIEKFAPNLKEYSNIMYLLINELDLDLFINLMNLIRDNVITADFVLEIFVNICNNELLSNFIKNVKLLNHLKIDIKTICKYNREVLLMNYNRLNNIINSYLVYGLDLSDDCYNYELLTEDYTNIIDRFIEIDEYDLIKNNISYIRMSSNDIPKRIILNKLIGNNSINESGKFINDVKTEENYFISDTELHNIIIENYTDLIPYDILEVLISTTEYDYKYVDLSMLEEFYYNDMSYKIDNLIISKNKIIKNYNKIKNSNLDYSNNEILFYSILYNHPTTIRYYDIDKLKEIFNVKKLIK